MSTAFSNDLPYIFFGDFSKFSLRVHCRNPHIFGLKLSVDQLFGADPEWIRPEAFGGGM